MQNLNEELNSQEILYKTERKKDYGKVVKSAFIFLLLTDLIMSVLAIFPIIDDIGLINIFVIVLSLMGVYFYMEKPSTNQIFTKEKSMKFSDIFFYLGLMYLINIVFGLITNFLVNNLGIPSVDVTQQITQSASLTIMLYAILLGPLFEEIQYRGFYLNCLKKYGPQTAILISTILFCFAHLNLIQAIGTIGIGLVISYVAYFYSTKMAVILHIINNAVAFFISSVDMEAIENITVESVDKIGTTTSIAMIMSSLIFILMFYSAIRLIFGKKGKEIANNLKFKDTQKENFKAVFKNGWFIAYAVIVFIWSIVSGFSIANM